MGSPAYKACPTFLSSLQATCQLSRCCTTLLSSGGFALGFSCSMPSCLFRFSTAYHFCFSSLPLSPDFLLLMCFSLYHNVSTNTSLFAAFEMTSYNSDFLAGGV